MWDWVRINRYKKDASGFDTYEELVSKIPSLLVWVFTWDSLTLRKYRTSPASSFNVDDHKIANVKYKLQI